MKKMIRFFKECMRDYEEACRLGYVVDGYMYY